MKTQLLNILQTHQGRENAITGKELARLFNQSDDRKIRLLIEDLIGEGYPILSSPTKPWGYFMATSIQEVKDCTEGLKSRAVQIFERRQRLIKNAEKIKPLVQGVLL